MIEQLQDGRIVDSRSCQHGMRTVFENKHFRWLCFDDEDAIQSCMPLAEPEKLVLPYQHFMMMWQLFCGETLPSRASLLGIGGGDIIRYLRSTFPNMKITAVDNDPHMAQLANKYFLIKPVQEQLTLQIEEAQTYIKKTQRNDLLFIDIVANNVLPELLYALSFWKDCHASLTENGIMAVNIIPESEAGFVKILEMLRDIFGHLPLCMGVPDHKNIVLLMSMSATPKLNDLRLRGVELQKNSLLPFSLCVDILAKDNGL